MIARALMTAWLLGLAACGSGSEREPDAGAEPDARAVDVTCDPVGQDCPADQKCSPAGPPPPGLWTGTRCVADNAASGSPATTPCFTGIDGTDTCDPASMCLQLGTGEGFCTAYCADQPVDTCDATDRCVLYDEDVGVKLCAPRCDLAAPDCPQFYACVEARAGPACVPLVLRDRIPR